MNFASLLKHHQTRYPNSNTKNQFTIDCNRIEQQTHSNLYHHKNVRNPNPNYNNKNYPQNHSGLKRRIVQPPSSSCIKLIQVYQSFQEDQSTQWILQVQDMKTKLHRFKPSKLKTNNKKFQVDREENIPVHSINANNHIINNTRLGSGQKLLVPKSLNSGYKSSPQPVLEQIDHNNYNRLNFNTTNYHPIQQLKKPQSNILNVQKQRSRKNYSPMNKIRSKKFGKQDNWMENLAGENKFSFGDDSEHNQVEEENRRVENQAHRENGVYQQQCQQNFNKIALQTERNFNQEQVNNQKTFGYNQNKANNRGVNLMREFQKCEQELGHRQSNSKPVRQYKTENTIKPTPNYSAIQHQQLPTNPIQKPLLNQLAILQHNHQQQSSKQIHVKNSCARPSSSQIIDFNLDIGFSFQQQFDKNRQTKKLNNNTTNQPKQQPLQQQKNKDIEPFYQFYTDAKNNSIAESEVINLGQVNDNNQNFTYSNYGYTDNATVMAVRNRNIRQMDVFEIKGGNANNRMQKDIQGQNKQETVADCKNETSLKKIIDLGQKIDQNSNNINNNTIMIKTQQQLQPIKRQNNFRSAVKPSSNKNQQPKQPRQSSPHRIYCKMNIRTLTPQKFKYPRIDSKIYQTQTDIKQFNDGTRNKQNQNYDNQQSRKQVQSEKKMQSLIQYSNKKLEQRDRSKKGEENNNDKIKRIVIHQVKNDDEINYFPSIKVLSDPQMTNNTKTKIQQNQVPLQRISQNSSPIQFNNPPINPINKPIFPLNQTPTKRQQSQIQIPSNNTIIQTSPRSPIQQKPKFHNQLANLQTNYNPTSAKKDDATTQMLNRSPLNNGNVYVRFTDSNSNGSYTKIFQENIQHNQKNILNNVNTGIAAENYINTQAHQHTVQFQSNYAYKPLGLSSHVVQGGVNNNQYQPSVNNQQNQGINTAQNSQPPSQKPPHYVRTYSPYYPVNGPTNTNVNFKPVNNNNILPQQQTNNNSYGYASTLPALNIPPATQPANNFIKIASNYASPFGDNNKQQKPVTPFLNNVTVNNLGYPNPNLPPLTTTQTHQLSKNMFLDIGVSDMGIKCVQSKIYDPSNKTFFQGRDPKQSSIQFSLRIDEHFHMGNRI